MGVGVIIPVKRLRDGKKRLSVVLSKSERSRLVKAMFFDVLKAIRKANCVDEILVVTPDNELIELVKITGISYLKENRNDGVNAAVLKGNKFFMQNNINTTLVIPADIPLIDKVCVEEIVSLSKKYQIVITPSLNGDGTNILVRNPPNILETFYDKDSFHQHLSKIKENKLQFTVFRKFSLMLDIDSPEDLFQLKDRKNNLKTYAVMKNFDIMSNINI